MFCQTGRRDAGSGTPPPSGRIEAVPEPPAESTKTSLRQRLTHHVQTHGPALDAVNMRYRGVFACIDGQLPVGVTLPLCRLRYHGSASVWGFARRIRSQLPTQRTTTRRQPGRSPRLRLRPLRQQLHRLAATSDELTAKST
jgi:hypothetical protein